MRARIAASLIVAASLMPLLPASGQDRPDYLDDRSTASSVVASFYNAINRQEYSRAYSYFGIDAAGASYEDFKAGYADTASVSVKTGAEISDGAAGSTYYTLPVAIDAQSRAGKHKVFAGCYTLRLVQPAVQDTPQFSPLHIEKAALKVAKGSLDMLVGKPCAP
ncbi:hypothetical protein [Devosia sp.]|uniref:hypothetical protein n=1 Tax=Devosia sp. TaxID=1871048 RepID=UPI0032675446